MVTRRFEHVVRAAAVGAGLTGGGALIAVAGRHPLGRSSPVSGASARASITGLVLLLIAAGLVFLTAVVLGMWRGRRRRKGEAEFVSERPAVHWAWKLVAAVLPFALGGALVAAVIVGTHPVRHAPPPVGVPRPYAPSLHGPAPHAANGFAVPGWLPWTVLAVLLGGAVAGLVFTMLRRTGSPASTEDRVTRRAVEAAIAALEPGGDPRAAVISAYAAMERTLAAGGVSRRDAEAPREYLHRVLSATVVGGEATTLTHLFEEARFSTHAVSEGVRDDARATLASLRRRLAVTGTPPRRRAPEPARRPPGPGSGR